MTAGEGGEAGGEAGGLAHRHAGAQLKSAGAAPFEAFLTIFTQRLIKLSNQ